MDGARAGQQSTGRAGASPSAPPTTPVSDAIPASTPPPDASCFSAWSDDATAKSRTLLRDCTTDQSIVLPDGWTFDGDGHTVFASDPPGGRLKGGVIAVVHDPGTVRNVVIDGSRLTAPCLVDRGQTNLAGVMILDGEAEVSGVSVRNMSRMLPPEAAPETDESIRESCGAGIAVLGEDSRATVDGNDVSNVGYAGIVVESAEASVSKNVIERAADTGILAAFGAHVRISPANWIDDGHVGIQLEGERTGGRVADNVVEGMDLAGISVIAGAQAAVANNLIADCSNGISLESANGSTHVDGNRVERPGQAGIRALSTSASVTGNTVLLDAPDAVGILGVDAPSFEATDNSVSGSSQFGITAVRVATATIAGNTVEGVQYGIGLGGPGSASIESNQVINTEITGIGVGGAVDVSIRGNTVTSSLYGIEVEDDGTNATMTDNRVTGCAYAGILASRGSQATITANSITDSRASGIRLSLGASGTVTGNTIEDSTAGIVVIYEGSRGTVSGNRIVRGAGSDNSALEDAGILVAKGAAATVVANTVTEGRTGIVAESPGTTATIEGNSVTDTDEDGIAVRYGATAGVVDNTVVGAGGVGVSVGVASEANPIHGNDISRGDARSGPAECAIRSAGTVTDDVGETNSFTEPRYPRDVCIEPEAATASPVAVPEATPAATPQIATRTSPLNVVPCQDRLWEQPDKQTVELTANCTTEESLVVPDGWTFDGNGHTVWPLDPLDRPFAGGVIARTGGEATVRDVTIDGGFFRNACPDTPVTGVSFSGAGGEMSGLSIIRMLHGTPDGFCGSGVTIAEGSEVNVVTSTIAWSHVGILIRGQDTRATVSDVVVSANVRQGVLVDDHAAADIVGSRVSGPGQDGIGFALGSQGTASGNMIQDVQRTGIWADHPGPVTIENNTISSAEFGIATFAEDATVTISSNALVDIAEDGFDLAGGRHVVTENTIDVCGDTGLFARDGAHVEVNDNKIVACGTGMSAFGRSTMVNAESVEIVDPAEWGLFVADSASISFADGAIEGTGMVGVGADTAGRAAFERTTFRGGSTAIVAFGHGTVVKVRDSQFAEQGGNVITMRSGAEVDLTGNTILGPGPDASRSLAASGIILEMGATGAVTGNQVSGFFDTDPDEASCGIEVPDPAHVVLAGNTFPPPGNEIDVCRGVEIGADATPGAVPGG
ncbi:MAG: right-handed parallel beta-helix repeat-containing protein [Thermomicrobiales bacterium]